MRVELGGTLDWPTIRTRVAQKVRASDLFDVFLIEGHASADPSNQYMLSQVADCNIYLLILGYKLRVGTKQEYQKAIKQSKDMLINLYDIEHDDECKALINEVEKNDYCCYQKAKQTDRMAAGRCLESIGWVCG